MLHKSPLAPLLALIILMSALALSACSGGETTRKASSDQPETLTEPTEARSSANERAGAQQPEVGDSKIIPVGDSPVMGPNDASVTIVAFSDFQCPYCARGAATVDQLAHSDAYRGKVRVVFKHFPLSFHQQAEAASRAALAAGEQGKFWQMHDLLYDNQREFRGKDDAQMKQMTSGWAGKLGLDVEQFERDFDKEEYRQIIERDVKLAQKLGVQGTPNFFVNGVNVQGAQPLAVFEELVDEQLAVAEQKRQEGVGPQTLYPTLVAQNYEEPTELAEPEAKPPEPQQRVEMVPVDKDDAVRGSDDALVTIVEFSDFQCPFCGRVQPALEKLSDAYGDKVRLVFKHYPLPFHQQADEAAKVAMAAQQKGKFWEMHDLLFENQSRLGEDGVFVELGAQVGLSEREVERALQSEAFERRVEEDMQQADRVGARGTPNFFVNGVQIVGAQPYAAFEALVDEQLAVAEQLKSEEGLSGDELYEAAVAFNEENTPEQAEEELAGGDEQPAPRVDTSKLTVDDDQVRGPEDAKVTAYVFSDFQCPYCRVGAQRFDEALERVDEPVKVVFKHYPLPFHDEAVPAAKAAMAAGEQDKFWQMHDLLFREQQRLDEDGVFVELAEELGLEIDQFEADMAKAQFDAQIKADMQEADDLGVRGTPAFFVDGTRVIGAQSVEVFEEVIEEALSEKQ